jgi:hypothetical protein
MIATNSHWLGFFIRGFVVTAFTTVWRSLIGNAVVEELGSGAIQIITIPLLLI